MISVAIFSRLDRVQLNWESYLNWKDTVSDFQSVVSSGKRRRHVVLLVDDAVEFPKRGQGSRPHPHDEIFINEAVVLRVRVQLIDSLTPVDWFYSS